MNINWNVILIAEIIWIIIYKIRNYILYLYVFISANIHLSLKFLKILEIKKKIVFKIS